MKFIALVISLLLERVLGEHERWRTPEWFTRYAAWMKETFGRYGFWAGPFGVLLLVGLPALVVGLIHAILVWTLWSLFALVFSVAVLLFCLGPKELDTEVSAYLTAVEVGGSPRAGELGRSLAGEAGAADTPGGRRAVAEAVLTEFNDRTFAVLFWFVLLGPLGAILYRASSLSRRMDGEEGAFMDAAARLHGILGWAPARLIALGFALAGSFEDTITDWKASYDHATGQFWQLNDGVIVAAGRGALRFGEVGDDGADLSEIRASLALVLRTLIFWLVLLGLLAITGFTR